MPLLWLIQRAPEHRPELRADQRAQLVEYFADDVRLLEEMTGWDLADWLASRQGGTFSVRKARIPERRVAL